MEMFYLVLGGIAGVLIVLGLFLSVLPARSTCPACHTRIWRDRYCSRCGIHLEIPAPRTRPRIAVQNRRQPLSEKPLFPSRRRSVPFDEDDFLEDPPPAPRPREPSSYLKTWISQVPSVKVITTTTCLSCRATISVSDRYCGHCGTLVTRDEPGKRDK